MSDDQRKPAKFYRGAKTAASSAQEASKTPLPQAHVEVSAPEPSSAQQQKEPSSYVSHKLANTLNKRASPDEQVDGAQLNTVLQTKGNSRLFVVSSLQIHEEVDSCILAESDADRPETFNRDKRNRCHQVWKCIEFKPIADRMKAIPNGDKLLKLIQASVAAVMTKYNISTDQTPTHRRVAHQAAGSEDTAGPVQHQPPSVSPGKKENAVASRSFSRALFTADDATVDSDKDDPNVATIASIKNKASVIRAYEIFLLNTILFDVSLVFFKNVNIDLATEISCKCKSKKKTLIRKFKSTPYHI